METTTFQERGNTLLISRGWKTYVYTLIRTEKIHEKFLSLKDWHGITFADGSKIFRAGNYLLARNRLLPNGERVDRYACLCNFNK